jgi:hypothetical protein
MVSLSTSTLHFQAVLCLDALSATVPYVRYIGYPIYWYLQVRLTLWLGGKGRDDTLKGPRFDSQPANFMYDCSTL